MNILRIKGLTWVSSVAIGGLLGWEVYDFLEHQAELEQYVPTERLEAVLKDVEEPEPPKDDVVDYRLVKNVFMDMNWTGEPPRIVVETPTPQGDVKPPATPVSDLLKVMVLQVDTVDEKGSLAYVLFTDPKLTRFNEAEHEDRILRVEKRLHPPYDDIRVKAITREGVHFAFDDEEREGELLPPVAHPGKAGIVVVDNAVMPQRDRNIWAVPNPTPYNPKQTVEVRRNEFQIGSETLDELNQDYSRILSQDLRYRTYRDGSGKISGIQITDVRAGSLPAKHGVTKGEILISINGHPVKSVNDAVAFVKANSDTTEVWVAVFLKQGKEITRTYHSPSD